MPPCSTVLLRHRRDYDNALRRYNNILKGSTDFSQSQALAEQQIAQSRLAQAQKDYDDLQKGPDPDKLALAEKRIETAKGRISAAETGWQLPRPPWLTWTW